MNWQRKKHIEEQRAECLTSMKAILNLSETEKRDLKPEESAKFDGLSAQAEAFKTELERFIKMEALENAAAAVPVTRADVVAGQAHTPEQPAEQLAAQYRRDFDHYLRTGQVRALTVGSAGIVGDRPFQSSLVVTMKKFAGVIEAGAEVIPTTTGNDLGIPTLNDTDNEGVLASEGVDPEADAESDTDATLGNLTLGAYKFDSLWIKLSVELLRDSAYNVEQAVLDMAAQRIGRAFNRYSTTGNNSGQPAGFANRAVVGKLLAATNAITYDEWIDFEHSLDQAYRDPGRSKFQLHDLTLAALRKLKNPLGQYIWTPGAAGIPERLDNYGYVINNHMDHVGSGAGKIIGAFGDWSRFKVRTVAMPEVVRANELFIGAGLVGFKVFQRMDCDLADAAAVKLLQTAHGSST